MGHNHIFIVIPSLWQTCLLFNRQYALQVEIHIEIYFIIVWSAETVHEIGSNTTSTPK